MIVVDVNWGPYVWASPEHVPQNRMVARFLPLVGYNNIDQHYYLSNIVVVAAAVDGGGGGGGVGGVDDVDDDRIRPIDK